MATSYKAAIPSLKKFEGGLVFIKTENQWTNRGVQYTTYVALAKQLGLLEPLSLSRFKVMSVKDWEKFIKHYWDKATFQNAIVNEYAALMMFQAYWGSGNTGIAKMQAALNKAYGLNLATDGIVGIKTITAINSNSGAANTMWVALFDYYMALANDYPAKYGAFKQGWANRLNWMKPERNKGLPILALLMGATGIYLYYRGI